MSKLKLDEYFMCINVIDWQRRSDPARRMLLLLLPTPYSFNLDTCSVSLKISFLFRCIHCTKVTFSGVFDDIM